eukprot:COSAG01_NODE_2037_length_8579_cov_119.860849_8_plen_79_part_00
MVDRVGIVPAEAARVEQLVTTDGDDGGAVHAVRIDMVRAEAPRELCGEVAVFGRTASVRAVPLALQAGGGSRRRGGAP